MRALALYLLGAALSLAATVRVGAFQQPRPLSRPPSIHLAAKGFGGGSGGGFGATSSSNKSKKKKVKKSEIKKTQQKILKKYGTNVAEGTQKRIEQAMAELPPHLHVATQLYQQLQKWNARLDNMSVLQQAQLSQDEMDGARRAQEELNRLAQEHDFDAEHDLHNLFQQITWDASADAKAANALMAGDMAADIQQKVDGACRIVAEAVGKDGTCLDIGCGYGVLVPHLQKAGVSLHQIHGIDLSPEMIKNARRQHPRGVTFEAVDFLNHDFNNNKFESIIFCSALHDFSDLTAAVQKAASLLQPRGKLVIAHPRGAAHVTRQSNANPVLVKRSLPTAEEWESMLSCKDDDASEPVLEGLTLETAPMKPNSPEEDKVGYLAVLTKD